MEEQIKAILVEDEPQSREVLELKIKEYCPGVMLVAKCANITEAAASFVKYQPQLIFLDIDLNGENGFDFLKITKGHNPYVIIVSGKVSPENFLLAIENRQLVYDFLEKPFGVDKLVNAVEKVKVSLKARADKLLKEQLNTPVATNVKAVDLNKDFGHVKIAIADGNNTNYIELKDFDYCSSANVVTTFHLLKQLPGSRLIDAKQAQYVMDSSKSIGKWETELEKYGIIRIHNEMLVNTRYVTKYIKEGKTHYVQLKRGINFVVSDKYKVSVMKALPHT